MMQHRRYSFFPSALAAAVLAAAGACSKVPGTEPGRKIEVMTGEKKIHTFAFNARDTALAMTLPVTPES